MFRPGDEVWVGEESLGVCGMEVKPIWIAVGEGVDGIEKMKVPGGWLYRTRVISGPPELLLISVALAFVPSVPQPATKKQTKKKQ